MTTVTDTKKRPLESLRISVTDRCNLRCDYCMPEESYNWLERQDILSFEELSRLADTFIHLGVKRIRLTGGEPLLRKDLPDLIKLLSQKPGLEDLALTTNGTLLSEFAQELRASGLHRITLSLDTLDPHTFETLTRRAQLKTTLEGLIAAKEAGFSAIKVNTVLIRGVNDHEIVPLLRFAQEHDLIPRFIEYMDVGGATMWDESKVIPQEEILKKIEREFGPVLPVRTHKASPARAYMLDNGTTFGIIASTTAPFCGTCDRIRLTADGNLVTCLYAKNGFDIRTPLRNHQTETQIRQTLRQLWGTRTDSGADDRLHMPHRGPSVPLPILQNNPHLEMHTRGG